MSEPNLISPEDCLSYLTTLQEGKLIIELDHFDPNKKNDETQRVNFIHDNKVNVTLPESSLEMNADRYAVHSSTSDCLERMSVSKSMSDINNSYYVGTLDIQACTDEQQKTLNYRTKLRSCRNSPTKESHTLKAVDQLLHTENLTCNTEAHYDNPKDLNTGDSLIETNRHKTTNKQDEITITPSSPEKVHYQCGVCSVVMRTEAYLRRHMRVHDKPEMYKCLNCDRQFNRVYNLKRHGIICKGSRTNDNMDNVSNNVPVKGHETNTLSETNYDNPKDLNSGNSLNKSNRHKQTSKQHQIAITPSSPTEGQHQCGVCFVVMRTGAYLRRHMRVHDKTEMYKCLNCNRQFNRVSNLKRHGRICKVNRFNDNADNVSTNVPVKGRNFNVHSNVIAKKNPATSDVDDVTHICLLCSRYFTHLRHLKNHMKFCPCKSISKIETILKKHTLNECNDTISSSDNDIRKTESKYTCETCNANFTRLDSLYRHIQARHCDIWKQLICKFCNKTHTTLSKMQKHSAIHIPDPFNKGKSLYKCETCERTFTKQKRWRRHTFRVHSERCFSVCKVCNKSLKPDSLKRHMRIHTTKLHCNFCQMTFKTSFSLEKHKRKEHAIGQLYKCTFCNQQFQERSHLKLHSLMHVHEDVNVPYKCHTKGCNKQFMHKTSLKIHINTHAQKLFACSHCSKKYSSKHMLEKHIKYHLGVKPFVCKICHKGFVDEGPLKRHSIVHTGARQFKCPICDQGFSQECSVKRHMVIHTGDKPFKCLFCDKCYSQSTYLHEHVRRHHPEEKKDH